MTNDDDAVHDDGSPTTSTKIADAIKAHWLERAREIEQSIAYQRDVLLREPSDADLAMLDWIRSRHSEVA